jgi:hypothetical protein
MRKRIRKIPLAKALQVTPKTIENWSKPDRGVIPPPHYFEGSPIPYWFEDETVDRPQPDESEEEEPP